jgi:glycerol-3-phosphate dehydrogenase
VLEQPQLRARLPDIGREVLGALYAPTGGIVCPYTLVIAMAEHAARNSVLFEFDTTVTGFRREDGAWIVQTNRGEIRTRTIFNCAGTYADQLNNMVSADTFTIQPRFGSHILLDKEYITHVGTTICQTPVKLPTGGHTKGMGVMPSADRTVILGCDSEDVADRDDTACTARSLARIVDYFEKSWTHFPIGRSANHFPFEGIINAYGGLRAHSDRNDFIIGEVSDAPGFFNAAGIESPGLTAGPAIGRHLADLAVNRLQPEKKKDFLPGRQVLRPFRQMSTEERREAIRENPDYGKIVCRCEWVTEAEVRDAIRRPLGARNVNAVKMRTRAGMGRCQGGFCGPRVLQILCEELSLNPLQVTLSGGNSYVLAAQSCQTAYQEPTDAPG